MLKSEIAKRLGKSSLARRVQFYTDRGLVTPDIDNPKGRGTNRDYSEANLVEFRIIEHLKECGQSLDMIALVMPFFLEGKNGKHKWWTDAINNRECTEKAYSILICKPGEKPRSKYFTMGATVKHTWDSQHKKIGFREYLKLNDSDSLAIVFDLETIARSAAK